MAFTKVVGPGIHTQSNIVSHNINSSGIITATKFVGPITGGGGDFNAGIVTCTELDVNGNGDISGNLVIGGNLTANGDFTTLNTTLREVEILRVDADTTAIAGIITQRGTGDILNLYDDSTEVFSVDASGRVKIGTTSNKPAAANEAGIVFGDNTAGTVKKGVASFCADGAAPLLLTRRVSDGNVLGIADDVGTKGLIRVNSNNLEITSIYALTLATGTGHNQKVRLTNDGKVGIGSMIPRTTLDVNGDVKVGSGITFHATNSRISLPDGTTGSPYTGNLELGNARDFTIVHDSNHTYMTNRTGNFYIGISDSVFPIQLKSNNTAEIYHGSTKVLNTTSTGVNIGVGLTLADNIPASFGNGNDLQIVHNSSENHFLVSQNTFFKGNIFWGVRNASNQGVIEALTVGRTVTLYGGSSKVLSTSGIGVTIRNSLFIEDAEFNMTTNGTKILDFETGGSNSVTFRHNPSDGALSTFMQATHGGSLKLYDDSDGAVKLTTSAAGITVTGEVAATQDYPNFRPTVDFNFAAEKKLDPSFTYQRTGAASFVNEFGKIVLVGDNTPRFDHDIVTRESKGLLIEEARTNLALYSDMDMDSIGSGYYNNVNLARAEGPDGVSNSALQVTFTAAGSSFVRSGLIPCAAGVEYTFSVWIKKVSGSFGNSFFSYPQNAAAGLFNNSGFVNTEGQSLSAMPTGVWKRFTQTKTTASGTTAMDFVMPGYDSNGAVIQYYGLQMEAGSYATSYIPSTNGSSTSRGADIVLIDDIENEMGYNQLEGTAIMEYNYTEGDDGAHTLFAFSGTEADPFTSDSRQWLRINKTAGTARGVRYSMTNGNTSTSTDSSAVATPGVFEKFAFAYEAGDQDLFFNGTSILDTAKTPATNIFRLTLGNIGWNLGLETTSLEGHIKRFMYYPKKLSNSQLNTLTS